MGIIGVWLFCSFGVSSWGPYNDGFVVGSILGPPILRNFFFLSYSWQNNACKQVCFAESLRAVQGSPPESDFWI